MARCDGNGAQSPITFFRFEYNTDYAYEAPPFLKWKSHRTPTRVTPYEWFSAPDGRDWVVPFTQRFTAPGVEDISLTPGEEAFVLNNFATLAEYFAPRDSSPATIDTYVDERRSYCESCDTHKKGVQWWTTEFETSQGAEGLDISNVRRSLISAGAVEAFVLATEYTYSTYSRCITRYR
eukprot:COSAG02_NODE_6000_length_3883_cov_1.367336_5_plen_179_part_00